MEASNMQAAHLQDEKYMLLTDSQDLDDLCEDFPTIDRNEITGALVVIEDCEWIEVWVTESSKPYSINADYDCIRINES